MKTRTFVSIVILVLAVLVIIGSCATKRKAIAEEDFFKTWSGTWINTELKGATGFEQKIITYPDGTWKNYTLAIDTSTQCEGVNTFTAMETDSEGNIWYISKWKCLSHGTETFQTGKISDSGKTFEFILNYKALDIEEWDPEDIRYTYRIYYRQ